MGFLLFRFRQLFGRTSVDQQIASAALVSGGLAILVKSVSFLKEVLVAAIFGVSFELDAYLIALMLIGLPHGIVVNAVQWALIPEFVRADSQEGTHEARGLLRRAVSLTLLMLLGILLIWVILFPLTLKLLTNQLGPGSIERIQQCFALLCIYYFTSGTLLLGYAVLQAKKQFISNGLVPLATPLVSAMVLLVWRAPVAEALALGMVIGFLIEILFVERLLRRLGLTLVPCRLTVPVFASAFTGRIGKLAPGAAVMSMMALVEQASAAQLGVGAVSTLGFANKLPAVVSSLSVVAIGVAIFPYFADMVSRRDFAACRRTLRTYGFVLAAGGTALASLLIWFSDGIVQLFFQRGAFSQSAAIAVSWSQQAYLLQLPGALVLALALRLLLARGRSVWMLLLNGLQLGIFVVAIAVCLSFSSSPSAIAISYSIAVTATAIAAYLVASRTISADSEQGR